MTATAKQNERPLTADEWIALVRAWAASFPQRDYVVDDSCESNYGDGV